MTYVLVRMFYQIDSELHRNSPTLLYGSHNVHCALGSPWNFYKIKYPIPRDSDLGGPRWVVSAVWSLCPCLEHKATSSPPGPSSQHGLQSPPSLPAQSQGPGPWV